MRLDQYLHENGFVPSRQRGHALIMEGLVYINGEKAAKAGQQVPEDVQIEVREGGLAYVSRGGLKLEKALKVFPVDPTGKICMDIGASTGGFTDCLLQNGAQKVYAVDVGYGQLAWKLRCDERVAVMERCNARHLKETDIFEKIDLFTVDTSFISLKLILPVMQSLSAAECEGVCLVKPQFEAGKEKVGKNGVVRSKEIHAEVISNCMGYAKNNGFSVLGLDYSPVTGPKGNIEFLLYVQKVDGPALPAKIDVHATVARAHEDLTDKSGEARNV